MTAARPGPKRGLGRGLGSLIPTAPQAARPESGGAESKPSNGQDGSTPAGRNLGPAADPRATRGDDHPGDGDSRAVGDPRQNAELAPISGAWFAELPVESISANAAQPRQVFDEEAMAELVHSITEVGLLQPVVVRSNGDGGYELVMGERRWRAAQQAGLTAIPAIVRETDDDAMLRDALLENLHRAQLNPLEEASAYQQLLEDFDCTHEQLAERIGRSRPQISNTLRLLRLSPAVQRRVASGVLSAGHARSLLSVDDPEVQDRLAQRVVAEGISVRGLEEIVAVGTGDTRARRQARPRLTAPELVDFADRLGERLETRVKVDLGRSKGKITVEFATLDDLQRIVDIMDPRNRTDRVI